MILENSNGVLKNIIETDFKLEKSIQKLVEENMRTLLGLEFIKSEFSIENYRMDTIAYDIETNAFVIIEYKKGRNESLVDQGLSYLHTLIKRKADFVLLFNEVKNEAKRMSDFDWSQTRIVFISPRFTRYQINAVSFKNFPFSLYEIKQFGKNLIEFEEVQLNRNDVADFNLMKSIPIYNGEVASDSIDDFASEIKVYTEDDQINQGSDLTKELYFELRERILQLGNINVVPLKRYIAFKASTNVCDITINQKHLNIAINLSEGKLVDNNKFAKLMKYDNGTTIGHLGNGDYQCKINDESQIDYLITLIRQSYESNK